MDVGPFVVADAEASELIEPGKRPLHDPAPPAEATPVRRAALRDKRENPTGSQSVADRRRVVAAITEHAGWTTARSASFALQWGNRIDQGQGFLRVVPVSSGQAHGERDALSITDQMPFASTLGAVGRIGTRLRAAMHRAHRATIDHRPRPIDLILPSQPIEQRKVDQIPNTGLLPIAQASPTGHSRAAAQFLRQHLPRNPASQHEKDAGETHAIRDARPSTFWSRRLNRQERLD